MRKLVLWCLTGMLLAGCGQTPGVAEQSTDMPSPQPTAPAATATAPAATATANSEPTVQPTLQPSPTILPPVPATVMPTLAPAAPEEIVDEARTALAEHLEVAEETLTLSSSTAQDWSDGAMGCPDPSFGYTQVIIPGYLLVFSDGTNDHAVHTAQVANPLILCQDGLPVMLRDEGEAQ